MPVGRTQDERKAETRQRLLQAAGELIAERGVAGASVDALAEAADRTSGAIYAHFGGKEGLLVALLDEWKDALSVAVRAEFEAASDERERIGSLWHNFVSPPPGTGDDWTLVEHELWLYACRNPEVRPLLAARYDDARRAFGNALPEALDARRVGRRRRPADRAPARAGDAASSRSRRGQRRDRGRRLAGPAAIAGDRRTRVATSMRAADTKCVSSERIDDDSGERMGERTVHLRMCPLCEAMCGLEVHVEDEQVDADPSRPRRRVEQGLPLPEGHDARAPAPRPRPPAGADGPRRRHAGARSSLGRGVRALRGAAARRASSATARDADHRLHRQPDGPQLLARPLRRAVHRAVAAADDLLGRHRRPVAEERLVHADVRRTCGGSRRPTSSAPTTGSSWAATRRRRRAACSPAPTCSARSTRIRERGGKVVVIDPRRTGTADQADEWVPIVPGTDAAFLLAIVPRAVRRAASSTSGDVADIVDGVDDVRALARRLHARARRRRPAASRPTTIRRLAREIAAAPTRGGLRPHRALQPGVRDARVVARRRREHPHRQLRPARRPHVRQPDRVVRWRRCPNPQWADGVHVRPVAQPGARRARGARPGPGVVPRRGDRHAGRRASSRRWSRSPATR